MSFPFVLTFLYLVAFISTHEFLIFFSHPGLLRKRVIELHVEHLTASQGQPSTYSQLLFNAESDFSLLTESSVSLPSPLCYVGMLRHGQSLVFALPPECIPPTTLLNMFSVLMLPIPSPAFFICKKKLYPDMKISAKICCYNLSFRQTLDTENCSL